MPVSYQMLESENKRLRELLDHKERVICNVQRDLKNAKTERDKYRHNYETIIRQNRRTLPDGEPAF